MEFFLWDCFYWCILYILSRIWLHAGDLVSDQTYDQSLVYL